MSAQTGDVAPSGPVSQRLVDRARFRVDRLRKEPNPIWIRELKQAARLGRTPIILSVLAILMTLLMASIGGIMSSTSSPAQTGVALFQTFFSLAFFVVALVGPAVAANSVASEREGRTWEAVLLTGMRPGPVARGKFLAAYTAIGMYIVMLAPVGALPFLFGGVTATEVIVAFLFLFLIALLAVAFGLAISSKLGSLRVAIVLTLLLAFPLSIIAFSSFGVVLSVAAHKQWPGVPDGPPVWLPTAYERAPFGLEYVIFLIVIPIAAVAIPAWFLYEVTIANLASATDDRSTGLKRWFLASTPVLVIAAAVPALASSRSDRVGYVAAGISAIAMHLTFCAFLFQGDPIGPSRRVMAQWERAKASRFLRFLGPGVMRSASLLTVVGLASLAALSVFGLFVVQMGGAGTRDVQIAQTLAFAGYAIAFFVFVVGLGTWLRARTATSVMARVLLFAIIFGVAVGPWIVAAIAGLLGEGNKEAWVVASPSPFYVLVMLDTLDNASPSTSIVTAGVVCAIGWTLLGLLLLALAGRRCSSIIREHEAVLADGERRLAEEDAAAAAARAAPPPAAPDEPIAEPIAEPAR